MHFSGFTMLRLLLPFAAGIGSASLFSLSLSGLAMLSLSSLILLLPGAFFFRYFFRAASRWIPGLLISLAFFQVGMWQGSLAMRADIPAHFSQEEGELAFVRIREGGSVGNGRTTATVQLISLLRSDTLFRVRGKLRLTVYGDSLPHLMPGQVFLLPARFREIRSRTRAGGFNYQQWLALQGIHHQAYIHCEEILLWKEAGRLHLRHWGRKRQEQLRDQFYVMMQDSIRAGLAAAMIIGEKSGLDEGVSDDFRKSGVVHVLCVSGMHTATVYAAALFLLHLVVRPHLRKRWMEAIPLAAVLLFALLTGLAPSVTRAAAMLSLYTLSRMMKRKTEGLNILAGAAFLMLLVRAEWLFSAGFQLSFLAVIAIMRFTNPLMEKLSLRNGRFRKVLGGMAVVSVVAQAGTSGLSLFHFHAFPLWFLPSNLLSLPLATLSIYTGILSLLFHMSGLNFTALIWVFSFLLEGMQQVTSFFAALPGGYPEYIRFTSLDLCFFYVLLLLLDRFLRPNAPVILFRLIPLVLLFWSTTGILRKEMQWSCEGCWVRLENSRVMVVDQSGRFARLCHLNDTTVKSIPPGVFEWARWVGVPQRNITAVEPCLLKAGKADVQRGYFTEEAFILYAPQPWQFRPDFSVEQKWLLITGREALQRLPRWLPDYPVDVILFDASVGYISRKNAALLEERSVEYVLMKWDPIWRLASSSAEKQGMLCRN